MAENAETLRAGGVITGDELFAGLKIESGEAEDMYLNFIVDKEVYGIGIGHVLQIIAMQDINQMPEMPPAMKGFIYLRGSVIPIYSLHTLFYKPEPEYGERTCIIIVVIRGRQAGLIADAICETVTIAPELISPPPVSEGGAAPYVSGLARIGDGQSVILLDASGLFR